MSHCGSGEMPSLSWILALTLLIVSEDSTCLDEGGMPSLFWILALTLLILSENLTSRVIVLPIRVLMKGKCPPCPRSWPWHCWLCSRTQPKEQLSYPSHWNMVGLLGFQSEYQTPIGIGGGVKSTAIAVYSSVDILNITTDENCPGNSKEKIWRVRNMAGTSKLQVTAVLLHTW